MQQRTYSSRIRITVDDREARRGLMRELSNRGDFDVQIKRLVVGDYVVGGSLLVERKTVLDFALSVLDGRLFKQAHRLTVQGRRSCLILEGREPSLRHLPLTRQAMQGALVTTQLIFGIPVLRSLHPEETVDLMMIAYRQLARRSAKMPQRHGRQPSSVRRSQLLMLQGVPGIGPERSRELLRVFGSPAKLAQASEAQIASVPGVGKTSARSLWRALHE
jgi:ERCC4-type nuclease